VTAGLKYELVTPERLVRSDEAWMVVVPGSEGDFGVMADHAPVITTLREGALAIYAGPGAQPEMIPVTGGFAEVNDEGLTVLAEAIEQAPKS